MDSRFRQPLTALCYGGIAAVIGGVLALVGNANNESTAGETIEMLGRLGLGVGVIYLLVALFGFNRAINDDNADDTN